MIEKFRSFLATNVAILLTTSLVIFVGLVYSVSLDFLITLLNGLFIGTMFGVTVAYGGLFWDSFFGKARNEPGLKPDVIQFVVMTVGSWAAYGLSVISSVYIHASDLPNASLMTTAISRYIAIVTAVGQITAPNYGSPLWAGRDNKVLWIAMLIGLAVACFTIFIQETNALAEQLRPVLIWRG